MSTSVNAPAAVLTVCNTCFRSTALNVVQPNASNTGAVAVANKLSAVSVFAVIHVMDYK